MSHVDEGLLHAWIDGAFGAGDPDGDAIEAHIAACAECTVRAEEARRLKARAGAVLQHVAPDAVRVEPFDRMVAARRASRDAQPRRRAMVPMAWAASIMLAVTAGWMARAYLPSPVANERAFLETGATAPAAEADDVAKRDADALARDRANDPTVAGSRVPEPAEKTVQDRASVVRPAEQEQQAVAGAAAGRVDALADAERRDAARNQAVQQAAAPPPPAVAARQREALPRTVQSADTAQRAREEAAKAVWSDAQNVYRFADATNWTGISLNEAARVLGRAPLRIDSLQVEGVQALAAQGLVRLRQKIADGVIVELLQRAAVPADERVIGGVQSGVRAITAEAVATDVLAAGDTPAITLQRNGLLIVVRGPITLDSLRALAARIR